MGTGLIYAAIVAAWAAYLVPLWLRRQDEAVAAREEGNTIGGRVVRRRRTTAPADEPADADRTPDTLADDVDPEPDPFDDEEEFVPVAYGTTSAARRRRTLLVLLLATTATAVVAAIGYAPWWTVAVPGGMVAAFIAGSAVAAGHERRRRRESVRVARATADVKVDAQPSTAAAEQTPTDPRAATAPRRPRDDGLWDPISVPLPTYVTKAKAPRTVRTISLSDPDTWTSGRLREPEPAAEPAADAATGTDDAAPRSC